MEKDRGKSKSPALQMGEREIFAFKQLLGLNRAHGAGALASAAGDAGVTNFTCHVTYTSKSNVMF